MTCPFNLLLIALISLSFLLTELYYYSIKTYMELSISAYAFGLPHSLNQSYKSKSHLSLPLLRQWQQNLSLLKEIIIAQSN